VTIDKILTKEEFLMLAQHMGNGNPASHFLTVWRDGTGNARYAKAKRHKRADVQARWTWDTIIGLAKQKTSMGLYPKNQGNQSTWAALDFDAHSGNDKLASDRAFKAFSFLQQYQDRFLLLTASGRGYHVFILAPETRPLAEWTNVLKQTCETIEAPIQDGICEAFPNERTAGQQVGRAIRLPGSFNPSTEGVELILAETMRPLINQLMSQTTKNSPNLRLYQLTPPHLGNLIEIREVNNSSSCTRPFWSASTGRLIEEVVVKHPINAKGTRNGVLVKLTGELFHKFGRELSERIIRKHYDRYKKNVTTALKEHMREFSAAWESFLAKAINSLSPSERGIFDQLNTESQREAFLLIRSFSNFATYDFPVALLSLADRLSITPPGASCVISKLVDLKAIEKTADARINSKSARYRWIANVDQPF
jgi:hypothetical protein